MIQELIHFLLMVLASVCGILLGAWLVRVWEDIKRKFRGRKRK